MFLFQVESSVLEYTMKLLLAPTYNLQNDVDFRVYEVHLSAPWSP